MAAGKIIVEEAGGVVLDLFGDEFDIDAKRCIVANNREIANQIIKCIKPN
jgi:fructose-1,6-bisphosphatase/inositol monophosphatase family enzyme